MHEIRAKSCTRDGPARMLVTVRSLVLPDFMIEIESGAVISA